MKLKHAGHAVRSKEQPARPGQVDGTSQELEKTKWSPSQPEGHTIQEESTFYFFTLASLF